MGGVPYDSTPGLEAEVRRLVTSQRGSDRCNQDKEPPTLCPSERPRGLTGDKYTNNHNNTTEYCVHCAGDRCIVSYTILLFLQFYLIGLSVLFPITEVLVMPLTCQILTTCRDKPSRHNLRVCVCVGSTLVNCPNKLTLVDSKESTRNPNAPHGWH